MAKRIGVNIYIESKKKVGPYEAYCLFALRLDKPQSMEMRNELISRGTAHFRWMCPEAEGIHDNPVVGQNVIVIAKGADDEDTYLLMKVIAVGDKCAPFLEDPEEIDMDDNCVVFVLSNIQGPIKSDNSMPPHILRDVDSYQPMKLSIEDTDTASMASPPTAPPMQIRTDYEP